MTVRCAHKLAMILSPKFIVNFSITARWCFRHFYYSYFYKIALKKRMVVNFSPTTFASKLLVVVFLQ
jgi:hypothetical protein